MAQTMLLFLLIDEQVLVRVNVDKLSKAQQIVNALNIDKVSEVRIARFSEYEGCEVVSHRLKDGVLTELPNEFELYNADPDCLHDEHPAPGGGVKCSKCRGWFCF